MKFREYIKKNRRKLKEFATEYIFKNDRHLDIIWDVKPPKKVSQIMNRLVEDIFRDNEIAKEIPELHFYFIVLTPYELGWTNYREGERPARSWIFEEEYKIPELNISICPEEIDYINENGLTDDIKQSFVLVILHEITHICQSYYKHFQSTTKKSRRIKEKLGFDLNPGMSLMPTKRKQSRKMLAKIFRVVIDEFFHRIILEGLAEFHSKYYGKELTEKEFNKLYDSAKGYTESFQRNINESFEKGESHRYSEEINDFIVKGYPYAIGRHVIYTTLYTTDFTLKQLTKFSAFKNVREYEKCMVIRGLQPLISITSGKGILDYKTLIEGFNEIHEKSN